MWRNVPSGSFAVGCGPVQAGTIQESASFTPYDEMYSHPVLLPVVASGIEATEAVARMPDLIDGMSAVRRAFWPDGSDAAYYLGKGLDDSTTLPDLLASGGILLIHTPLDPKAGDFTSATVAELGERATVVEVGLFEGILTYGDPEANGRRNHYLTWAESGYSVNLIAERSAESIVTLGRSLVCSP